MSIIEIKDDKIIAIKLDVDDLIYRGEGNLSLVITIKSIGKVIRIPKIINKEKHNFNLNSIKDKLLNEIDFSWNVMNKLFKPNIWLNKYLLIELSKEELIEIKDKIENSRPDFRKFKILPSEDYFGLLIDDYCHFQNDQLELIGNKFIDYKLNESVFSIEIKPKQGFISPELIDLSICKFRFKQEEKISTFKIKNTSNYCPLDLFSGDYERMKFALNSLIENPQNNFRLFKNREIIELTDNRKENLIRLKNNNLDKENLINLLIYILNHSFNQNENRTQNENRIQINKYDQQICKYHYNIHKLNSDKQLNINSILKSIIDVQQLDEIGPTKAYELFKRFKLKYNTEFNKWLNESKNSIELIDFNPIDEQKDELNYLKQQLTKFLYSLTAKDCSILITFQKILITNKQQLECKDFHSKRLCFYEDNQSIYLFTLALVDLDRKQPEKIETTFKDDEKRMKNFINQLRL